MAVHPLSLIVLALLHVALVEVEVVIVHLETEIEIDVAHDHARHMRKLPRHEPVALDRDHQRMYDQASAQQALQALAHRIHLVVASKRWMRIIVSWLLVVLISAMSLISLSQRKMT